MLEHVTAREPSSSYRGQQGAAVTDMVDALAWLARSLPVKSEVVKIARQLEIARVQPRAQRWATYAAMYRRMEAAVVAAGAVENADELREQIRERFAGLLAFDEWRLLLADDDDRERLIYEWVVTWLAAALVRQAGAGHVQELIDGVVAGTSLAGLLVTDEGVDWQRAGYVRRGQRAGLDVAFDELISFLVTVAGNVLGDEGRSALLTEVGVRLAGLSPFWPEAHELLATGTDVAADSLPKQAKPESTLDLTRLLQGGSDQVTAHLLTKRGVEVPVTLRGQQLRGQSGHSHGMVVVANKELAAWQRYVREELGAASHVLQRALTGDWQENIDVKEDDDLLGEHLLAISDAVKAWGEAEAAKQKLHKQTLRQQQQLFELRRELLAFSQRVAKLLR